MRTKYLIIILMAIVLVVLWLITILVSSRKTAVLFEEGFYTFWTGDLLKSLVFIKIQTKNKPCHVSIYNSYSKYVYKEYNIAPGKTVFSILHESNKALTMCIEDKGDYIVTVISFSPRNQH